MKKRILALALAGTTAFSVFGAAMSANAANVYWGGTSSHIGAYDGAYYQSYTPAGDINWNVKAIGANTEPVNKTTWSTVKYEKDDVVSSKTTLYTTKNRYDGLTESVKEYVTVLRSGDGIYFEDMEDFAYRNGYDIVTTNSSGQYTVGTGVNAVTYQFATTADGVTHVFTLDEYNKLDNKNGQYTAVNATDIYVTKALADYSEGAQVYTEKEVLNMYEASGHEYFIENDNNINNIQTSLNVVGENNVSVELKAGYTNNGVYTDSGATTLDAVDPTDIDAVLEETVYPSGVVYLYDYYDSPDFPTTIDADEFAENWAKGTVAELLSKANNNDVSGTIAPVTSYRGRGVREEVMYEWEDFLDELGISDASNAGLTRWAEDILENYAYTYYNADVIADISWNNTTHSWEISFGRNVNLYNFDQLIADIMELAPAKTAENAQTSELVYLMQQYHKYVDEGFVTENPVETDDWGDLLVALAQAPTEDDFRTSAAYRRYTNKVEDLVEQYEEAETSVAVAMAEEELYNFVTDYQSAYTYSNKADTAVLATAIDNTYFNTNWQKVGEEYAREDMDGLLNDTGDFESISEYSNAWALYPKTDYTG